MELERPECLTPWSCMPVRSRMRSSASRCANTMRRPRIISHGLDLSGIVLIMENFILAAIWLPSQGVFILMNSDMRSKWNPLLGSRRNLWNGWNINYVMIDMLGKFRAQQIFAWSFFNTLRMQLIIHIHVRVHVKYYNRIVWSGLVVRINDSRTATPGVQIPKKSMVLARKAFGLNSLLSSNEVSLFTRERTLRSRTGINNVEYKRKQKTRIVW